MLTVLLLTAVPFQAARAEVTLSGHDLLKLCHSTSDLDYGQCAGFVTGVAQAMAAGASVGGYAACHHENVRSQQLVDIYTAYAELFPEKLNDNAATVMAAALQRAFACGRR